MVPGQGPSENLLKMQFISSLSKTYCIGNSGAKANTQGFNKLFGWFWCKFEFENHWPSLFDERGRNRHLETHQHSPQESWAGQTQEPLLQFNREQPWMQRTPKRTRGNVAVTVEKQRPKVTAFLEGSALKHLEKHIQCPVRIYTWWFKYLFSWLWGKGSVGEFLNNSKGHKCWKEILKLNIMQLWGNSKGHSMDAFHCEQWEA